MTAKAKKTDVDVQDSIQSPILDQDEEEVMADLLTAYNRIRGWGLQSNSGELESAVHVIQGFIIQHMLGRVAPGHWSQWFKDERA